MPSEPKRLGSIDRGAAADDGPHVRPPALGSVDPCGLIAVAVCIDESRGAMDQHREFAMAALGLSLVRLERDAHVVREAVAEFFKQVHASTVPASSDVSAYTALACASVRECP